MTIKSPSESTLARYGLMMQEWWDYIPFNAEGERVCPICWRSPPSGRMVVDHEHVRGWAQMPPEQRRLYVRGVVCTTCNHFVLTHYGTPFKHRAAARYLLKYERRRKKWQSS